MTQPKESWEWEEEWRNFWREEYVGSMRSPDAAIPVIRAFLDRATKEEREICENKYENCPQCVGLREQYKKELRAKIHETIDELLKFDNGTFDGRWGDWNAALMGLKERIRSLLP